MRAKGPPPQKKIKITMFSNFHASEWLDACGHIQLYFSYMYICEGK